MYQEFLQDICKEIDRENEIITDLLDLVKMEKTDAEINISSVNINEILETVLKRLKLSWMSKEFLTHETHLIQIPVLIYPVYSCVPQVCTDQKIDRFKANNTMLKNSIVSEGYLDQNNESQIVDAQIAQYIVSRISIIST